VLFKTTSVDATDVNKIDWEMLYLITIVMARKTVMQNIRSEENIRYGIEGDHKMEQSVTFG
jgi:hypothetical protein